MQGLQLTMRYRRIVALCSVIALAAACPAVPAALASNAANVCLLHRDCNESLVSSAESSASGEGWLIYRSEPPQEAVRTLTAFLDRNPDHIVARLRLGSVLWELGREGEAVQMWRSVPDAELYFVNESAELAVTGAITEAMTNATIAQMIEPSPRGPAYPMYHGLCQAYRDENELDSALYWCALASRVRKNGWAQIALANVQHDLGRYEDALETLQKALRVGSSGTEGVAYHRMGQVYESMGRLAEGIDAYQMAVEAGRSNQWLYASLSKALLKAGRVDRACERFAQACQLGYTPSEADQRAFARCDAEE